MAPAADPCQPAGDSPPEHQVRIEPQSWTFVVPVSASVLEAALAAGLRLPSACRNGTCRACICRLKSGQVRYRIEWPGLSTEEKSEGWILPCVALAAADLVIEAPAARRIDAPA
ncbi:MAG: 2Fe-2S iron-sulfur cluster-binding protein [Leptothrix sp. (in: b-proteobacteria)]